VEGLHIVGVLFTRDKYLCVCLNYCVNVYVISIMGFSCIFCLYIFGFTLHNLVHMQSLLENLISIKIRNF
jgi:hypothetical protein